MDDADSAAAVGGGLGGGVGLLFWATCWLIAQVPDQGTPAGAGGARRSTTVIKAGLGVLAAAALAIVLIGAVDRGKSDQDGSPDQPDHEGGGRSYEDAAPADGSVSSDMTSAPDPTTTSTTTTPPTTARSVMSVAASTPDSPVLTTPPPTSPPPEACDDDFCFPGSFLGLPFSSVSDGDGPGRGGMVIYELGSSYAHLLVAEQQYQSELIEPIESDGDVTCYVAAETNARGEYMVECQMAYGAGLHMDTLHPVLDRNDWHGVASALRDARGKIRAR